MTSAMDQDLYDKPDGELIHLSNWVECVRSRKRPTAPVEAGVSRRRTWATRRSMEGVTGVWPIEDLGGVRWPNGPVWPPDRFFPRNTAFSHLARVNLAI